MGSEMNDRILFPREKTRELSSRTYLGGKEVPVDWK